MDIGNKTIIKKFFIVTILYKSGAIGSRNPAKSANNNEINKMENIIILEAENLNFSLMKINPHAKIIFKEPDGNENIFDRTSDILPRKSNEIKPHPYGVELGTLIKLSKLTKCRKLSAFLKNEFSSMGDRTAKAVCEVAELNKDINPKDMTRKNFLALHKAFKKVKIMAPPTDCLSPIGETLIKRSLKHETKDISL